MLLTKKMNNACEEIHHVIKSDLEFQCLETLYSSMFQQDAFFIETGCIKTGAGDFL